MKRNELRVTSTERSYRALKKGILERHLVPGQLLTERRLSEELGLSRTPIRQALLRLYQEGLLVRGPQGAFEIARLTEDDVNEVFEIREWIEGSVARRAAELVHGRPELVDRVEMMEEELNRVWHEIQNLNRPSEFEYDVRLHDMLVEIVGNSRVRTLFEQLNAQIHQVRLLSQEDSARLLETRDEHLAILAGVKAGNPDEAEKAMRVHVRRAAETAKRVLLDQERRSRAWREMVAD